MKRERYSLDAEVHVAGKIGRVQTLEIIPVVAGDSLQVRMTGGLRFAALRREIISEQQVDICAFYVPHRHVYGDVITRMIREGKDENETLTGVAINADSRNAEFLTINDTDATIPLWVVQGYWRIIDRYFRIQAYFKEPRLGAGSYSWFPNGTTTNLQDIRKYGWLAARLPHPNNAGAMTDASSVAGYEWRDLDSTDFSVPAVAAFDIRDLARVKAEAKTEIDRVYFNEYYNDLLQHEWGGSANVDADQRPEYLGRKTFMASGHDVDGTADGNLGSYVGKTNVPISFDLPRKNFPEHGAVWIMMVVRPPYVHVDEVHPLMRRVNPDYVEFFAPPRLFGAQKAVDIRPSQWLAGGVASAITPGFLTVPYGNHYRFQPNRVHSAFRDIPGYPFIKGYKDAENEDKHMYHQVGDFDDTFANSQMGHWQVHAKSEKLKITVVDDPIESLTVGT